MIKPAISWDIEGRTKACNSEWHSAQKNHSLIYSMSVNAGVWDLYPQMIGLKAPGSKSKVRRCKRKRPAIEFAACPADFRPKEKCPSQGSVSGSIAPSLIGICSSFLRWKPDETMLSWGDGYCKCWVVADRRFVWVCVAGNLLSQ